MELPHQFLLDYLITCTCSERAKFAQLRETFTQLQKSHQHFEKEVAKRKEREAELLALTEKLSSSNAELQVERSEWEAKVHQRARTSLMYQGVWGGGGEKKKESLNQYSLPYPSCPNAWV